MFGYPIFCHHVESGRATARSRVSRSRHVPRPERTSGIGRVHRPEYGGAVSRQERADLQGFRGNLTCDIGPCPSLVQSIRIRPRARWFEADADCDN